MPRSPKKPPRMRIQKERVTFYLPTSLMNVLRERVLEQQRLRENAIDQGIVLEHNAGEIPTMGRYVEQGLEQILRRGR